ncbi:MAG: hypothetical protein U0169_18125 [Polyangiaceae bacterium]
MVKSSRALAVSIVTAAGLLGATGCAIKTLENGIQITALQSFATATPNVKSAAIDWDGRAIEIENVNGDIEVVGEAGRTKVEVSATFFARAEKEDDAKQAMADIEAAYGIDEKAANFYVHCKQASKDFGSAPTGTTGCRITVKVPAGTTDKGVPFKARIGNGSLKATGLTAAAGQQMLFVNDNGTTTLSGLTGGVKVEASLGDVDLGVTPTVGSVVTVDIGTGTSGLGDITLRLPKAFAADVVNLSVPSGGKVDLVAFPDVVSGQGRGAKGTGAASISATVHGGGDVTLASF